MDIKNFTAAKIRFYRKAKGLTQKELGEKIGVKHNTVSGYESGTNEPEQNILFKIAAALEISINDLFPATTTPHTQSPTPAPDDLPPLTRRDERQIAKDLEDMLHSLKGSAAMGELEDEEDMDLLKASLAQAMTLSKRIAKKKFTPKKHRK